MSAAEQQPGAPPSYWQAVQPAQQQRYAQPGPMPAPAPAQFVQPLSLAPQQPQPVPVAAPAAAPARPNDGCTILALTAAASIFVLLVVGCATANWGVVTASNGQTTVSISLGIFRVEICALQQGGPGQQQPEQCVSESWTHTDQTSKDLVAARYLAATASACAGVVFVALCINQCSRRHESSVVALAGVAAILLCFFEGAFAIGAPIAFKRAMSNVPGDMTSGDSYVNFRYGYSLYLTLVGGIAAILVGLPAIWKSVMAQAPRRNAPAAPGRNAGPAFQRLVEQEGEGMPHAPGGVGTSPPAAYIPPPAQNQQCGSCGSRMNLPGARFCGTCGQPLAIAMLAGGAAPAPPAGVMNA